MGLTQPLFNGYQGMKLTTHLHLLLAKDLKQAELYSTTSMYFHAIDRCSFSFIIHIIIKQVLQTQSNITSTLNETYSNKNDWE